MSPEQATGDRLDGRSDVYSLGCVLYEMLAGEPPYTGPTAQAIIAKRFSEPIPHVRTLRDTVSEPVVQALQKALAKAPVDRFATAAQLASALAGVSVPGVTARPPLFTDIMTVLGELQGYPHSGVEKAAEALDASLDPWPWARTVFGMYAASRGRPNDVQRAVVSLQGLKAGSQECATRLSRALGHFAAAKLADNALKAEALFRAADVAIGSSGCFSFDRLFLHDVVRYQALRASFAAGGLDPASRWLRGMDPFSEWPMAVPLEFWRGRIAEARSDRAAARLHYERFVRWWADCDPELRPLWEEGPVALARGHGQIPATALRPDRWPRTSRAATAFRLNSKGPQFT